MHKKTLLLTAMLIASCPLLFGQPGNGNGNGDKGPSATLVFSPATMPDGRYGSSYKNLTLDVSGGKAPYSFSLSGGALPPGMSLSANGVFSGAPQAAGSYSFTVSVTDHSKNPLSGSQKYSLVIDPAVAQVTANAATKTAGAPDPVFTYAVGGLLNGDNSGILKGNLSRTPGESVGIYPISKGNLSAGGNYTIAYTGNFFTIVQGSGSGTEGNPPPGNLVFSTTSVPDGQYGSSYGNSTLKVSGGSSPYSFSVAAGDLPPGISLSTGGVFSGVPKTAGSYSFTVSVTDHSKTPLSASQNYTLIIDPAALTVSANNTGMTYGGTVPSLTVSYNGLVNGDKASGLTTPAIATTTATSSSATGAYSILASGAADPNYSFTYKPGTLTISPATLNVSANAVTKVFGAPDPSLTYTANGFANGDGTNLFTGNLSRSPGENVGKYSISRGSLSAVDNYSIGFTGN